MSSMHQERMPNEDSKVDCLHIALWARLQPIFMLTCVVVPQHAFYYMDPPACNPKDLPQFQPSHEMEVKRIRHAKEEAKKRGPNQQPQSQPAAKRQRADHPGMQHGPHAGKLSALTALSTVSCRHHFHRGWCLE